MLTGIVSYRFDPHILLNVQGVGYKVLVSPPVLSKLPVGTETALFTHMHVREDALELFGFLEPEDLKLFEYLISVSGIGGKTAVGVFAIGSRSQIISAIAKGDVAFFTAVPRLGKKNAQKLIIELKSKIGSKDDLDLSGGDSAADEVLLALQSFGFSLREASTALTAVADQGKTPEEKIKLALKYLGK